MKHGIPILLVDDHALVRDGVEAILQFEKDFVHIVHAASSAEALAAVRAHPPDIVLLDRRMPESDGFDLLEEFRKTHPQLRVIMMTASATPRDVDYARRLGAVGHLPKSVRRAPWLAPFARSSRAAPAFTRRLPRLAPGFRCSPRANSRSSRTSAAA